MSSRRFVAMSVVIDTLLVFGGFLAAFMLRFGGHVPARNFNAFLLISPVLVFVYLGTAWTYGLYDPERTETAWTVGRSVTIAVTVGIVVAAAGAFFLGSRAESWARWTIPIGWAMVIVLLNAWRLLFLHFGRIRWPQQRVILVGTGPVSVELATELSNRSQWGWKVIGLLDTRTDPYLPIDDEAGGFPILGRAAAVAPLAREYKANRVIVVSPVALRELVESLVMADELRVRVDVVPELYEIFIGSVDALIGDIPLMQITTTAVPRYYRAAKRAIDAAGAILGLIVTSPILLAGMLAILLSDGRPVIFSQERVGKGFKPFHIYKLRTMVKDAEKLSGPVLAEEDDPRVTSVGRFLRSYRIDELPQLVNILKGEMSFVGPRPERQFFVEQYLELIPGYRERFRATPGVTGLAQVSGGYATTPERKLKYDLIYLFHRNLAMDVQIVLETLRVVLTGRGAR